MWYTWIVDVRRTVPISLPPDPDLRKTLTAFGDVQQAISPRCFNDGTPLRAVPLQRACYHAVKGTLNSQMTITALRLVAGAYSSAVKNRNNRVAKEAVRKAKCTARGWAYRPKEIKPLGVCQFTQAAAMFLIGQRGRDADFRKDGTLSIWTIGGRKRLSYRIPPALRPLFDQAKEIDSVTVMVRHGRLYGHVTITVDVAEPQGVSPVGIDLNETNALVAVDADNQELFISGHTTKVLNRRTAHTVSHLQRKLAARKAEGQDTHSVRRVLQRLSRRRSRRTRDFAKCAAKSLITWAPSDAVLVFEDLQMAQPRKGLTRGIALRRRLALWQHGAIRKAVQSKAEMAGIAVASVNPAYTSQTCSRCGLLGERRRHQFRCSSCGHTAHADVNAAINIRLRFVQSRLDGEPSTSPEARSLSWETGKLSPSGDSR